MTRTVLPYSAPDLSALARLLERALVDHLATHGQLPGHVEMMNLLARGAGKRNLQALKAAAATKASSQGRPAYRATARSRGYCGRTQRSRNEAGKRSLRQTGSSISRPTSNSKSTKPISPASRIIAPTPGRIIGPTAIPKQTNAG